MTPVEALTYAVVLAAAASYLIWMLPGPCVCDKCPFHTNERRMEALRKAEAEEKASLADAERRHDCQHKGGSWLNGDPDKFACPDEKCPRNPKTK